MKLSVLFALLFSILFLIFILAYFVILPCDWYNIPVERFGLNYDLLMEKCVK